MSKNVRIHHTNLFSGELIGLKKKNKNNKKKEKIFIPNLTLFLALIFFMMGAFPAYGNWSMRKNCTYETKGIVISEESGKTTDHYHTVEGSYLSRRPGYGYSGRYDKHWIKIEVETDSIFNHEYLYADMGYGSKDDEIIIRYNPNNPDEYYFAVSYNGYKSTAMVLFIICGGMIVLSVFLFIHYNRPLLFPKKKDK